MNRVRVLAGTIVFLAPMVLSCGEVAEPLLGEWISVGSTTRQTIYVFEDQGRAKWVLELDEGPDTFEVAYRVDYQTTPVHLDIGPWPTGPLAGRTLFGVLEMRGPDRFRVDFEPADPDAGGADRPTGFSNQALTFVRKLN